MDSGHDSSIFFKNMLQTNMAEIFKMADIEFSSCHISGNGDNSVAM
jgi:hypothetical protein